MRREPTVYQERGEDSEEGPEAKNHGVPNSLIQHGLPPEVAAVPHAAPSIWRHVIVFGAEAQRRTLSQ